MKLVRITGWLRGRYILPVAGLVALGVLGLLGCIPEQISLAGNSSPSVTIKAPTRDVNVRAGQIVVVSYDVSDREGDETTLNVSYDLDGQADTNDEVQIATGLTLGSSAYEINTATAKIPAGTYYILLDAADNRGGRTVGYARGKMVVSGVRTFAFQEPLIDERVTSGDTVTIRFTSSETVNYTLFYDQDGQQNGNEITIATGSGQNVTQNWVLANIPPGTYYVGATIRDGLGESETSYAPGRVILDTPPSVIVSAPDQDIEVYAGETVSVEYQVLDADSDARVKIFIDVDRVPGNGNETTIVSGLSDPNGVAQYLLDTTSINPAPYFIGVSATDNLNTDITSYASGRIEVFDPELSIIFIEPATDVSVILGNSLTVSWQVEAPSGGGTMSLRYVKLDANSVPTGEETIISEGPIAPDATSFDTTVLDLESGSFYQLLIRLAPSFGGPVDPVYGPKIHVKQTPGITLKQPQSSQTVGLGDRMFIEWAVSNLESDAGQISAEIMLDPDTSAENGNEIGLTPVKRTIDVANNIYTFSTTFDLTKTIVPRGEYYLYLSVNDGGNKVTGYGSTTAGVQTQATEGAAKVIITIKPRVTGTYWMGDAGTDATGNGRPDSIVFVGFDFYDSAGSLVSTLGDFDGDGYDDFLIVAQYAKPFRASAVGEAYIIYGNANRFTESVALSNVSSDPNVAILSLNSVSTTIRGAILLGLEEALSPDGPPSGIQSALYIPDQTGDGVGELAIGIPYLHDRRGFYGETAAGLTRTMITLPGQFRRGGVIIATSENDFNEGSPLPQGIYFNLGMVGQFYGGSPAQVGWDLFAGTLGDPAAVERRVTNLVPGDSNTPSVHHIELTQPTGSVGWSHPFPPNPSDNDIAGPRPVPPLNREPLNFQGDAGNIYQFDNAYNPLLVDGNGDGDYVDGTPNDRTLHTGVLTGEQTSHFGSRVLGDSQDSSFGVNIGWWRGGMVASSPGKDPVGFPGIGASRPNAGVVYYRMFDVAPWNDGRAKPSNWVMTVPSESYHPVLGYNGAILGAAADAQLGPIASLGDAGIGRAGDFNGDGLEDLAIGAPGMNGGAGAAYVFYVRLPIPYAFDLATLNLANNDPERRAGVQINGNGGDGFGGVKPAGLDFNGDGFADAVFGNPKSNSSAGQVVLIFGGPVVASSGAGWSIDDVAYGPGLNAGNADPNEALGIVFKGVSAGDMAGAAVVGIGDFDGDGLGDLVIAAPHAGPRFVTSGGVTKQGINQDGDNEPDDLNGDGTPDLLIDAGLVYLVYGRRDIGGIRPFTSPAVVDLSKVGTPEVPGAVFVGKTPGDQLGGGMTTRDGLTDGIRSLGFAPAGDVDGDGLSDILISSVRASPLGHKHAGEVYLIFGINPARL